MPHAGVHGRGNHHGLVGKRHKRGADNIIGKTVCELCNGINCSGDNHQHIGLLGQFNVRGRAVAFNFEFGGNHFLTAQALQCQRGNKLLGRGCHEGDDARSIPALQFAD